MCVARFVGHSAVAVPCARHPCRRNCDLLESVRPIHVANSRLMVPVYERPSPLQGTHSDSRQHPAESQLAMSLNLFRDTPNAGSDTCGYFHDVAQMRPSTARERSDSASGNERVVAAVRQKYSERRVFAACASAASSDSSTAGR